MIAVAIPAAASALPAPGAYEAPRTATSDSTLTVSLVTCYPGPQVYELCGHEALRIRGAGIDSVWNYGVFDFTEPNFVGRFVSGQTDYMLAGYPFRYFMPEYVGRGSRVVEQDLNLTPGQTARLLELLHREQLPGNNRYRYNYVRDNCATRIVARLQQASDSTIIIPSSGKFSSFRDAMRHYHVNYPWYQFGIDLALGQGIDMPLQPGQQMFAPMQMMEDAATMRFADGRPFVKATRVLYEGRGDTVLPPTPWWASPLCVSIAVFAVSVVVCVIDSRRKRISRWWWSLYYGGIGLPGCLLTFLVFFSSHDSTSPNILIFWLNPLQLIVAAAVWTRRSRWLLTIMCWLNIAATGLLMLAWPMQPQSGNPAFFPLMASNLMLAATWAIISRSGSYNIGEKQSAPAAAVKSGRRRAPAAKKTRK